MRLRLCKSYRFLFASPCSKAYKILESMSGGSLFMEANSQVPIFIGSLKTRKSVGEKGMGAWIPKPYTLNPKP